MEDKTAKQGVTLIFLAVASIYLRLQIRGVSSFFYFVLFFNLFIKIDVFLW